MGGGGGSNAAIASSPRCEEEDLAYLLNEGTRED
jgi:hypothetical protein